MPTPCPSPRSVRGPGASGRLFSVWTVGGAPDGTAGESGRGERARETRAGGAPLRLESLKRGHGGGQASFEIGEIRQRRASAVHRAVVCWRSGAAEAAVAEGAAVFPNAGGGGDRDRPKQPHAGRGVGAQNDVRPTRRADRESACQKGAFEIQAPAVAATPSAASLTTAILKRHNSKVASLRGHLRAAGFRLAQRILQPDLEVERLQRELEITTQRAERAEAQAEWMQRDVEDHRASVDRYRAEADVAGDLADERLRAVEFLRGLCRRIQFQTADGDVALSDVLESDLPQLQGATVRVLGKTEGEGAAVAVPEAAGSESGSRAA